MAARTSCFKGGDDAVTAVVRASLRSQLWGPEPIVPDLRVLKLTVLVVRVLTSFTEEVVPLDSPREIVAVLRNALAGLRLDLLSLLPSFSSTTASAKWDCYRMLFGYPRAD